MPKIFIFYYLPCVFQAINFLDFYAGLLCVCFHCVAGVSWVEIKDKVRNAEHLILTVFFLFIWVVLICLLHAHYIYYICPLIWSYTHTMINIKLNKSLIVHNQLMA